MAADQEGGQIQQLRGSGFTPLPSAVDQGRMAAEQLSTLWAGAGPGAARRGGQRQPGTRRRRRREGPRRERPTRRSGGTRASSAATQGRSPGRCGRSSPACPKPGWTATVKHFPGLGRVTGNTDVTSQGITDETTTATDSYLEPFRAGIEAGAGVVMVSSARYRRIDPANLAVFSPAAITGLLRTAMGYSGVVISDDIGIAEAVLGRPRWRTRDPLPRRGRRCRADRAAPSRLVPAMVSAINARARGIPDSPSTGAAIRARPGCLPSKRRWACCTAHKAMGRGVTMGNRHSQRGLMHL